MCNVGRLYLYIRTQGITLSEREWERVGERKKERERERERESNDA